MDRSSSAHPSFEQDLYDGGTAPLLESALQHSFHNHHNLSTLTGYPAPPPSPPFSAREALTPAAAPIILPPNPKLSWRSANRLGNEFLCLPRSIRDRIWSLAIFSSPNAASSDSMELPEAGNMLYPDVSEASQQLYVETCLVMIPKLKFILVSCSAVLVLMNWLNEFDEEILVDEEDEDDIDNANIIARPQGLVKLGARPAYNLLHALEFTTLSLLEKKSRPFKSMTTHLLHRSPNLSHLTLTISLSDLPFIPTPGPNPKRTISIPQLRKKYDIDTLISLPQLEVLKLVLEPFMALGKKLVAWEKEREKGGYKVGDGVEGFWGLKEWVEGETRSVLVECPRMRELVPGYRHKTVGEDEEMGDYGGGPAVGQDVEMGDGEELEAVQGDDEDFDLLG